ncbi:hypothetical protein FJZ17_01850 [Candidatus Pacearchaeota archaeon]|nr:hypothetical protein [Candidatus Pacearchaeota archaeon]
MLDQYFRGLTTQQIKRLSARDITLVFSKKTSFQGRVKPAQDPDKDGFEFVFRKPHNPAILVYTDRIFGIDSINLERGTGIKKRLNGQYVLLDSGGDRVPCQAHLANNRSRYKELQEFLSS